MIQLNEKYNQEDFLDFLINNFLPDFKKDIRPVNIRGLKVITKASYLGQSKLLDLHIFELSYSETHTNKRVALAIDGFKIMRSTATFNALIVFNPQKKNNWRLSLMSLTPEKNEKGKVSVHLSNPHRFSFALGKNTKTNTPYVFLIKKGKVSDSDDLRKRFSIEVVNKEFYTQIAELFTELVGGTRGEGRNQRKYPGIISLPSIPKQSKENQEFAVRLIGRLIFCWFLREKKSESDLSLIPKELLSLEAANNNTEYYHSVLEPLFFEVLNKPLKSRLDEYRDNLFDGIPYLNGGLFTPQVWDFFDPKFRYLLKIPDEWIRKLFEVLELYNFTVDENTSVDIDLSIDPEMLGRIFENLLAEINPETGETARKSTGSYYTPRTIVDYMVDESLIQYLKDKTSIDERKIRTLVGYNLNDDEDFPLDKEDRDKIIESLSKITILDPACGSGAFPIGALQKIVFILQRIDPEAKLWFKKQVESAVPEIKRVLEKEFEEKNFDYIRKLGIIRQSIFGVDIQPIATEIARLRCFLTLVVDERVNDEIEANRGIEPLPNLDFKFVTANSLIGLPTKVDDQIGLFEDQEGISQLKEVRDLFFNASGVERENLKLQFVQIQNKMFQKMISEARYAELTGKLSSWNPFGHEASDWFDPDWMFGIKDGFDIVIGNPPYVSTKEVDESTKKQLEENYGFADDLYSHFYFKGLHLCKKQGVLSYITSKTFWTIQTKKNVRELLLQNKLVAIYDTDNPFTSVMVDTSVVLIQKDGKPKNKAQFLKSDGNYNNPTVKEIDQAIYENAVNKVIFNPNQENLAMYDKYNDKVKILMDKWWSMINTSKNISKYRSQLEHYRNNLKAGDVTLLGLITDGGVGLQTGNNGKFIGAKEKTKQAQKILESRPEKLWEVVNKKKTQFAIKDKNDAEEFLAQKTEKEVRILFDSLKDKFGINLFGKGYIYRIISDEEIADVSTLTKSEKQNGISKLKPIFVNYDKGDRDGNRWYLLTPFLIDWSEESVGFLKKNSGKVGEGMTVFRNPQFYFKEGFSWNLINGTRTTNDLKFTITAPAVNDMASNKLASLLSKVSNKYITAVCNSKLINTYTENFINFTVNFPHNSTRQIPIIIPTNKQIADFESVFDRAYIIKVNQFNNIISEELAEQKLKEIQKELDRKVLQLYGLTPEEIAIVEGKNAN